MSYKQYRTLSEEECIEKLRSNNEVAAEFYTWHMDRQQQQATLVVQKQFMDMDIKGLGEAGCFELAVCLVRHLISSKPKPKN